mmetsp:Transcript_92447/g.238665  ORF Transcript_92447/g.238665 Transcript_92447/m.238665 type:complete len:254 (-) Transcript_92447:814-1575(-)
MVACQTFVGRKVAGLRLPTALWSAPGGKTRNGLRAYPEDYFKIRAARALPASDLPLLEHLHQVLRISRRHDGRDDLFDQARVEEVIVGPPNGEVLGVDDKVVDRDLGARVNPEPGVVAGLGGDTAVLDRLEEAALELRLDAREELVLRLHLLEGRALEDLVVHWAGEVGAFAAWCSFEQLGEATTMDVSRDCGDLGGACMYSPGDGCVVGEASVHQGMHGIAGDVLEAALVDLLGVHHVGGRLVGLAVSGVGD